MATDLTGADRGALPAPRRRSRLAVVVAASVAVPMFGLVAVLATREPATTRVADSPLAGRLAPGITADTMDGEAFRLADSRGQWVWVNFFATWCLPCREEHPDLIQFHERHRAIGDATVVGVIYDDETEAVRRFRDEEGGSWPMLVDPDGAIGVEFGVAGVPESFLIAPTAWSSPRSSAASAPMSSNASWRRPKP